MKLLPTLALLSAFAVSAICHMTPAPYTDPGKVTFSKGNCLRKCPVYTFELDPSGDARFNGLENVKESGIRAFKVPDENLTEIKKALKKIDFSKLQKSYNGTALDMPVTTITYGSQTVTFKGYAEVPKELTTLSALFEKVVANQKFIDQ